MTNFNCTIRISGPKVCTVREKTATMSQNTTRFRIYKTMRISVLPNVGTTLINYNPVLSSPKANVSIFQEPCLTCVKKQEQHKNRKRNNSTFKPSQYHSVFQDLARVRHHPKPSPLPLHPRPHVRGAPELYRPQQMADLVIISFIWKKTSSTNMSRL